MGNGRMKNPIQFQSKFKKSDLEIESKEVVNLIKEFLDYNGYGYVKRNGNKIFFHRLGNFNFSWYDFILSGTIIVKENSKEIIVINWNWFVLLIPIPFLTILLLAHSNKSSFDGYEIEFLEFTTIYFFIGYLIISLLGQLKLKREIKRLVKSVMANAG